MSQRSMLTVRTRHSELHLDDLSELKKAVRLGLVRPDDEVQTTDQPGWRKVSELAARRWWSRFNPWTVVVTLLSAKRS